MVRTSSIITASMMGLWPHAPESKVRRFLFVHITLLNGEVCDALPPLCSLSFDCSFSITWQGTVRSYALAGFNFVSVQLGGAIKECWISTYGKIWGLCPRREIAFKYSSFHSPPLVDWFIHVELAMAGSECTDGQNTVVEPRLMVSRAKSVYLWAATRGMQGKTPASNLRAKNSQNLKLFVLHGYVKVLPIPKVKFISWSSRAPIYNLLPIQTLVIFLWQLYVADADILLFYRCARKFATRLHVRGIFKCFNVKLLATRISKRLGTVHFEPFWWGCATHYAVSSESQHLSACRLHQ